MDFAALPPEINSARMYAGPGAGPMLAAAAAWDGLAAELHSAAASYHSVVSGLTGGPWSGPASASMAAVAASNVAWMTTTADQAEQTGAQAKAAAAAFEAAFAMHVPPPVIAANRGLLAMLAAPNFLGQNTPAIMAAEADYMEMWAQNAAAMYGYADASAAAATLTPFTPPAVSQAAGSSVGSAHTTLSQLTSAVPTALQGLASPAASTLSTSGPSGILSELSEASSILQTLEGGPLTVAIGAGDGLIPPAASVAFAAGILANGAAAAGAPAAATFAGAAMPLGSALVAGAGSSAGALTAADFGSGTAAAGLGKATLVGSLSVPQAWAPAISSATAASPGSGLTAAPAADAAGPGGLLGGLPRTGASVRARRGIIFVNGMRPRKVIPPRGYTG